MVLVVRSDIHFIYSDKHTGTCEEIQFSPPNLSEGGSLRSPIIRLFIQDFFVGGGGNILVIYWMFPHRGGGGGGGASGMPNRTHDL